MEGGYRSQDWLKVLQVNKAIFVVRERQVGSPMQLYERKMFLEATADDADITSIERNDMGCLACPRNVSASLGMS